MRRDLILGIGNVLLSDEGAGIHAVHYLADHYALPSSATVVDGGTLSFSLAACFENTHSLIVFDAARLNEVPGAVRSMLGPDMDQYLRLKRSSVHEVGLADVVDIARLSGNLPEKRALIAIQPASTELGLDPTPAVKAAIPVACEAIHSLTQGWLHQEVAA